MQLGDYVSEIGKECVLRILIARNFPKKLQRESDNRGIKCFMYAFSQIDKLQKYTLEELKTKFQICYRGGE